MLQLLLSFALIGLSIGQYLRPLIISPFPGHYYDLDPFEENYNPNMQILQLCTYTDVSYEKCLHAVGVAENSSIPFNLECVRKENRESCIRSVADASSDMVVLSGHGYKRAREAGLRPIVFAKEDEESVYIAVAPRNITFIGVQQAPIYFNHSNDRAFHAATYFNLRMGHDICRFRSKAALSFYISIIDAANYVPSSEEILICPDRTPNEFQNYRQCNVEAGLQRAVFVKSDILMQHENDIRNIFETITERFGQRSAYFNFFDTFQGQDDVIFKKNTLSFDFVPTYKNGVDENVFNELHCNEGDDFHDIRLLL